MNTERVSQAEAEEKLWEGLKKTRTGMLGLVGAGEMEHFQPMTGFTDPETNSVFFFTRDDTDLARRVGSGLPAMYTLVTEDTKLYACLMGELSVSNDRGKIDKFWNPVAAAWYPEGKEDPHLTLLRLELEDARVWLNDKGAIPFMYEVVKANLTRSLPDSGDIADVRFQ